MLQKFTKTFGVVRFGTEKNVGFTALNAIFDSAVRADSRAFRSRGGGRFPRTLVELSRC